jgi:fructose-bisphosphate aldolase class II
MPLTTMKGMLREARREHRAIGAFNVANYEGAAAVVQAAEAEKSPVIIQVFQRLFTSNKAYDLAGMILRLAHRCTQPVAVHLDHGADVQQVKNALAWGYTSVMFDGSKLPFDENVKLTRFCADYAKTFGATCEGEIGHVAQGDETALTDVGEAVDFAKQTGVDA